MKNTTKFTTTRAITRKNDTDMGREEFTYTVALENFVFCREMRQRIKSIKGIIKRGGKYQPCGRPIAFHGKKNNIRTIDKRVDVIDNSHPIASSLHGPSSIYCSVPMYAYFNRAGGKWSVMENEISSILKANAHLDGNTIMRVELFYHDFIDRRIPYRFKVTLTREDNNRELKTYVLEQEPPKNIYTPVPMDIAQLISGYEWMMREQSWTLEIAQKEEGLPINLAGIPNIGYRPYEVLDFISLYGDINVPKVDYRPSSSRNSIKKQRPWVLALNRLMNQDHLKSDELKDEYFGENLLESKGLRAAAVDHIVTLGNTRIDAYANLRIVSEYYNSSRHHQVTTIDDLDEIMFGAGVQL
jgi:hypothetical protein